MSSKAITRAVRAEAKRNIKQATQPGPVYSRILHELYLRAFETTHPLVMTHYKTDASIMFLSSKAFTQAAQTAAKVGLTDPFPTTAARAIVAFLENTHAAIAREGIDGDICTAIGALRAPTLPVFMRGENSVDDDHKHAIKKLLDAAFGTCEQSRDVAARLLNMIKLVVIPLLNCMLICKRVPSKGFLAGICYAAGFPDELIKLAEMPAPKKKSRGNAKSAAPEQEEAPAAEAAAADASENSDSGSVSDDDEL